MTPPKRTRPDRPKPVPKPTVVEPKDDRDDYFDVKHTVQTKGGNDLHLVSGGEWLTDDEIREATSPEEE